MVEYGKELGFEKTTIEDVIVLDLPVHGDNRGWFKENWQRAKMSIAGAGQIPDFNIVQNNISFNAQRGVTRGIHAEPWDKFISVATGSVFGAWVDLRAGSATFGKVFTTTITPDKAIFIPRGVGNSFQALEDNTAYTYLVNDHWSANAQSIYTFVNLADPALNIAWPIELNSPEVELSDKDKAHPNLVDVEPMRPKKTLVIGANGQLGRAILNQVQDDKASHDDRLDKQDYIFADVVGNEELGVIEFNALDESEYSQFDLTQVGTIINCAAFTAVDAAETLQGRQLAWKLNAKLPQLLTKIANQYDITLVHISSDYVFDGELCNHPAGVPCIKQCQHTEGECFSPLGVYAQSKAAGDVAVELAKKHYILRTSWVVGDGNNFAKTMYNLAQKGVKPEVIDDQFGRLTFTKTLADVIFHILENKPEFGVYNISNGGKTASWNMIAKKVFELAGKSPDDVSRITTYHYDEKNYNPEKPISPRPANSTLNLDKIEATGFTPTDWETELTKYINGLEV
ncbi:sugar nucleotide-binding protein [Actinomycetota bacterium]|nr:sugar nucleotide-binding protein [Actinomycetota bacterium]